MGVSPGQARSDFMDYINRLHDYRDFDTQVIFLSPGTAESPRTSLKSRLLQIQKSYQSTAARHTKKLKRLLLGIPETAFSPFPGEPSLDRAVIGTTHSNQTPDKTEQDDVSDSHIYLDSPFTKRCQQIEQLEMLVTSLIHHPKALPAAVYLEEVRNEMKEVDRPEKAKIKGWLQQAAKAMDDSDLEEEEKDMLKQVYTSFHTKELLFS